jgi:hypothetical protein
MRRTYSDRWLAWALFMAAAIGGILGLLTAPFGIFPR